MSAINFDNFEKKELDKVSKQEPVHLTTYSVYEIDRVKYFQLDTYGKSTREKPNQASQTIQLSEDDAIKLISVIKNELEI
ncbi:hypothetical protein DSECCO2_237640 [anaerobic digester metagenome]